MPRNTKRLGSFSAAGVMPSPGTERDSSSRSLTPLRSICSASIALTEMGRLSTDSCRLLAVTMISSSAPVASLAGAARTSDCGMAPAMIPNAIVAAVAPVAP
jgi:hypothetical protein